MAKEKIELVSLADLHEDDAFYPRNTVSGIHAQELADAISSGSILPPIVADRKTGTIIDGMHRFRAYLLLGYEKVPVIWRDYATAAEMYTDALALNAMHGLRLSRFDYARILIRAGDLGISAEVVASALRTTPTRLGWVGRTKTAPDPSGQNLTVVKGTFRHLAGETPLTEKAMAANARAGGMSITFYLDQVLNLLANDMLDLENPAQCSRLERIVDLGQMALATVAA